jgi:cobalamin biosynthesis Mg chelatase CobN
MKKIIIIVVSMLLLTAGFTAHLLLDQSSGGSTALAQQKSNWVVKIDDKVITMEEFEREFGVHVFTLPLNEEQKDQYSSSPDNRKKFLTNLINDHLIYQEAVENGYLRKEEVQALIKVVSRRAVNEVYLGDIIEPRLREIPDEQIEAIYNQNRKVFANMDIDMARQQIKMQLFQKQYLQELEEIIDELKGEAKVIRNDDAIQ